MNRLPTSRGGALTGSGAASPSTGADIPAFQRTVNSAARTVKRIPAILAMHDQLPEAELGFVVATRPGAADIPVYPVLVIDVGELVMVDHLGIHREPRQEFQDHYAAHDCVLACRAESRESIVNAYAVGGVTPEQTTEARAYVASSPRTQGVIAEVRVLLAKHRPRQDPRQALADARRLRRQRTAVPRLQGK